LQTADFWQPGPTWVKEDECGSSEEATVEARHIVGAWYTSDYYEWAIRLLGDINEYGHGVDFKEIPKPVAPTWEHGVMGRAMRSH